MYTSLNGRTFTRLEGLNDAGYKRWANTEWWHEGYDRLWLGQGAAPSTNEATKGANQEETPGIPSQPSTNATGPSQKDVQQTVVYLTADSREELTELKPEETYIIGGICDHNRYKVFHQSLRPSPFLLTDGPSEPLLQQGE